MEYMLDKYREYFNIDPEYFPQVNEAIINSKPDYWKKFYPHETFVKLINDVVRVISRKQRVSIWVEGAYGTGKSHAVLTLKKLLDASEEDTREYFEKYKEQLSTDLYKQFQQLKMGYQKILTVHRYGSSNIRGDSNLVFAIQESIVKAMQENGISRSGNQALKDSVIKWLSDGANKAYFNTLVKNEYQDLFAGDDVDAIIEKLNKYSGEGLQELMGKIMRVAEERQFKALSLDVDGLVEWIRTVIKENDLKAIMFIWDEFTEYFRNNMRALTGFQKVVDMSGSDPFYLMIVTHNVTHIFPESDSDWKKILGRFVSPICNIELPENMAFRLMGAAMEKNEDPLVQEEWERTADDLYERTHEARQLVKVKAHIADRELKAILPIHPYTALLLKHISSAFDSNQRSMFDFIKNDRGDEIKGFQWFIDNYGPYDDNPLLTIDMLWDFFYEKGKEYLSHDIRSILDCYYFSQAEKLGRDEKRVLRTVLLLQAISRRTGDNVDLFIPNEKNLNNAFEGSDLENDEPTRIANSLIPDILFRKSVGNGKFQYSALVNMGNSAEIAKQKEEQKRKSTSALLNEGNIDEAIALTGALRLRYEMRYVSIADFKATINHLRNQEGELGNKIMAVVAFAKDDMESIMIGKSIKDALADGSYNIVFIDASITPLGNDLIEQYAEAMANAVVNLKSDRGLADQYERNAKEVLRKWRNKIAEGEFIIYTESKLEGERLSTLDLLYSELSAINRKKYPNGLETGRSVTEVMWQANSLPAGVECGIKEKVQGQYRSGNIQTKLENYIGEDAWQKKNYWIEKPHNPIAKIKQYVEGIIKNRLEKEGRIAIREIYDSLEKAPYGFMPCNLTAFVLGFILKEYATNTYTYSDGMANNVMSDAKLKEMVAEIIKHHITPIPRYRDKYIVTMTDEEKAFDDASSIVFNIERERCTSIEQTRERIRQKMKELSFPIWCLKSLLDSAALQTKKRSIERLIDDYSDIANNNNTSKTDSDIAIEIGKVCITEKGLVEDLAQLVSKENCIKGMTNYLSAYKNGELVSLALEIGDNGQYINRLRDKFDADAANWAWTKDTANRKIDEVILEYQIILASNVVLPKNVSFDSTIREWCDRCNHIRISYLYAKNNWEELSEMMELLYNIKRSGQLLESQKKKFLEQIKINGLGFNNFYNNQTEVFKRACSYILGQRSEEDIKDIFFMIPTGVFTTEKSMYQSTVERVVEKFDNEQGAIKLKKFWSEKTRSKNPREWSALYLTPILCMVPDKEVQEAQKAFSVVNMKRPEKASVDRAMAYFEKADFFDKLEDKKARDTAFNNNIIKSYDVLLDNIDEVREYLNTSMSAEPYDWFGLPEVDRRLYEMAEYKYNGGGCEKALKKIDNMDIADVKKYLKELIHDNLIVGMEIIKHS